MLAKLTGQMNETEISIPGNQIFVVFQTNIEIVRKGFHALIIESKYFDQNKQGPGNRRLGLGGSHLP